MYKRQAQALSALTLQECGEKFADGDCCFSIVESLDAALGADRVKARGLVTSDASGRLQALFPARVDGFAPPDRRPLRNALSDGSSGLGEL